MLRRTSVVARTLAGASFGALALVAAGACGPGAAPTTPASSGEGPTEPPPDGAPAAGEDKLGTALGVQVYDAQGGSHVCQLPKPRCGDPVDRDFADLCKIRGYVLRRCGCEFYCSGDVSAKAKHYDENGVGKTCAPARDDCTPPAHVRAAFQDACADRGFRLAQCGCEWLCSGKVSVAPAEAKPEPDSPPAP